MLVFDFIDKFDDKMREAFIYYFDSQVIIVVLLLVFAVFYAVSSVTMLPLALSVINHKNKVFGVGVFYCGFEIPNGILEAFLVAEFGGL